MLLQKREERLPRDQQYLRILDGDGARGEGVPVVGGDGAKRVSGSEDLQDHVLAGGGQLGDFHPARHDRAEVRGGITLGKHRVAATIELKPGHLGEPAAVLDA